MRHRIVGVSSCLGATKDGAFAFMFSTRNEEAVRSYRTAKCMLSVPVYVLLYLANSQFRLIRCDSGSEFFMLELSYE